MAPLNRGTGLFFLTKGTHKPLVTSSSLVVATSDQDVAELLAGQRIDMPPLQQVSKTFKKAPRARKKHNEDQQGELV